MTVDVPVAALLVVALFTDLKSQRVPNQLTFGGMMVAVFWSTITGDTQASILGILVAFVVMFPGWVLGGAIRAGDAKLLMAVGGFYGPLMAFRAGVLIYLLAMPFGLAVLIYKRRLSGSLKRVWQNARKRDGEGDELTVVPFVPVVALAVLLVRSTEVLLWW